MTEALDILKASIKSELLSRWLPGKEGGLSGLVEIAALGVAERCANIKLPVSQYYCTQCDHSHRADSSIGKEHLPEPVPGGDKW